MKKELSYLEFIKMIDDAKKIFEHQLEVRLDLTKVQSPLFLTRESGLQDALTGVEKAVSFEKDGQTLEIAHSLAKWKRFALYRYGFDTHTGLYTDMKAIRTGETVDATHSLFVEQWDWEKVIDKDDRTIDYLKDTVRSIYKAIRQSMIIMHDKYSFLSYDLPKTVSFITSQELEDLYPDLTPKEREDKITREKKAVFIIGIGDYLASGVKHDDRSPDYDDWSLDGDLMLYFKHMDKVVEVSSMGIRVDKDALLYQLEKADCLDRLDLEYHKLIMDEKLPYTIGGGIGISRILMLLLQKEHIAMVQESSWTDKQIDSFGDMPYLQKGDEQRGMQGSARIRKR